MHIKYLVAGNAAPTSLSILFTNAKSYLLTNNKVRLDSFMFNKSFRNEIYRDK